MKVQDVSGEQPFEEICLQVTIESKEELAYFWAMANTRNDRIRDSTTEYPNIRLDALRYNDSDKDVFFDHIDTLVADRGLKR